jgi:hypothetical protein
MCLRSGIHACAGHIRRLNGRGNPEPPQLERGGGGDGRCDAEEPTGRYAAYTERTITVEK